MATRDLQETRIDPSTAALLQSLLQSYGAMRVILGYLPQIEQLKMQGLAKLWYSLGAGRLQQPSFVLPAISYLASPYSLGFRSSISDRIFACKESGTVQQLECKSKTNFSNDGWDSCQVGRFQLFQFQQIYGSVRILHIDLTQGCFTVEQKGRVDWNQDAFSLANFKNRFVFLINGANSRGATKESSVYRYSLARSEWEQIPKLVQARKNASACSLGDSVYVLCGYLGSKLLNSIEILSNPGAHTSSSSSANGETSLSWNLIEPP